VITYENLILGCGNLLRHHLDKLLGHLDHRGEHVLHLARGEGGRQPLAHVLPLLAVQVEQVLGERIILSVMELSAIRKVGEVLDQNVLGQLGVYDKGGRLVQEVEAHEGVAALPVLVVVVVEEVVHHPILPESDHISIKRMWGIMGHSATLPVVEVAVVQVGQKR